MTPLDKPLKRAISIAGDDYVVTLTPEALKIRVDWYFGRLSLKRGGRCQLHCLMRWA